MPRSLSEVAEAAGEYFAGRSPVHRALWRVHHRLNELGIAHAVAGGLAVNAHGHVRMTSDIDLLMRPEDLATFKAHWLGRGWAELFAGSRGMRDTAENVKIDVLLAGGFPGDGQPKPVAFPDPATVAQTGPEGLPYLPLSTLIELKLASGMTAPHRLQDLSDVIQLIRANALPPDYAQGLHPYVREKFAEMWRLAQVREDY